MGIMKNANMRIGIDIGRVLICPRINGVDDTSFLGTTVEQAMKTPPAPHAFRVVRALVDLSGGAVWLVSKCGPSVQRKTRAWLEHVDFYGRTGMDPGHLRFCLERHQKAGHAKELLTAQQRRDIDTWMQHDLEALDSDFPYATLYADDPS